MIESAHRRAAATRSVTAVSTLALAAVSILVIGVPSAHASSSILNNDPLPAQPTGITVDGSGIVYTAENLNNGDDPNIDIVSKITPTGVTSTLGTPGDGTGPGGIAIDGDGNIYTANYRSNSISKITPTGDVTTTSNNTTGGHPVAIAVDGAGAVYTANYSGNSISKFTPSGQSFNATTSWASIGSGTNPNGIAFDASGNLYTANQGSSTVSKITPAADVSVVGATGPGNHPNGIAVDHNGNVFTSNNDTNDVSKFAPNGSSWDQNSNWANVGTNPIGITVDSIGNVYTANNGSNDVSMITTDGSSSILGPTTPGSSPWGIAVDRGGNAYTANHETSNVSKITAMAPGSPPAPRAVAGDTSVRVTVAPGVGGPPTSYSVVASPGSATCAITAPATACTVGNLTNGTGYTFTARATNGGGTSAPSPASNQATPTGGATPQTPVGGCVTSGGANTMSASKPMQLMRPGCETNSGETIGVRVNRAAPRASQRGDIVYYQLFCRVGKKKRTTAATGPGGDFRACTKRGALKIRARGHGLRISITWFAPATGKYSAYTKTKVYKT